MRSNYRYWILLGLSVVLWCINILHYRAHRQEMLPHEMASTVNRDLKSREAEFNKLLKNEGLLDRLFSGTASIDEVDRLVALPFNVYGYQDDTLRFWNNSKIIGLNNDSVTTATTVKKTHRGTFARRFVRLPHSNRRLVVLIPITVNYPLENDYLHSRFLSSDNIPIKTQIAQEKTGAADEYPLMLGNKETFGYLVFHPDDIEKWAPDALLIIMLLLAVLTTVAWMQMAVQRLAKNRASLSFGMLLGLAIVLRILLFQFGLPFHLDTLRLFSPMLYGSSRYLSSLGDLFIDLLLLLWLITFVATHTPYKTFFTGIRKTWARVLLAVITTTGLVAYTLFFVEIIKGLILDSSISFDVTHFYAINIYTVYGLLAIISIMAISCMVLYLINVQLAVLIVNKWLRYVGILGTGLLGIFLFPTLPADFSFCLLGGLLIFIFLIDIPTFKLVSRLFEPRMIIWALIFCCFCTGITRYFNEVKEENARRAFVDQHLTPYRDLEVEFSFDKAARKMEHDAQLKHFFVNPSLAGRKAVNQHLETQYLTGQINKYDVTVYLFNGNFQRLFNKDTSSYQELIDEKAESIITNSGYLFYKESILDRHYYLSYIPVYSDTVNRIIGYVIIDMDLKRSATETVYPELLQPLTGKASAGDNEYAYAVYVSGKLVKQTNDYPFPVKLKNDTLKEQQFMYQVRNGNTELVYKIADGRTVIVVHYHSELLEAVTLFSYLFGIQILIAICIFLYQLYLSSVASRMLKEKLVRLTLRRRVHLSMLAVVFVSFCFIGFATIWFFTSEYEKSNDARLQNSMQVAKQSVQDYLAGEDAFEADLIFDTVSKSSRFKIFLTELAASQKVDINVFDDMGNLMATSQEDIYDKGLLSRMMRPDAFHHLSSGEKSLVIQNERVGKLSYSSAYQPLRDDKGTTLGYINVPFFTSKKDLDFQISNIVVTLINLYAFIFLISSVLTVGITRWITKTFDIIISQFDKLNLEKNERIQWSYDDEIGRLVREYNKMVEKVEANAALLAQSEREIAWREMARQVAHEIKNPLTPMKLNIQYLQQAMQNDNPNIKQLTERVSTSIIEQIDNLSYIASEFSNFAKMPEAKPEEIDLCELLDNATELYNNTEGLEVTIEQSDDSIVVFSDRSQLLRVFTNLLENAKQAIPQDKAGIINVHILKAAQEVTISITDNGIGIPEDVAKRIFQPYFTTKSSGTGLGLAMTRKIIEFWKGAIWFETKEDHGTTFFIRLPLCVNGGE